LDANLSTDHLSIGLDANFLGEKLAWEDRFRQIEEKSAFFHLLYLGQNT